MIKLPNITLIPDWLRLGYSCRLVPGWRNAGDVWPCGYYYQSWTSFDYWTKDSRCVPTLYGLFCDWRGVREWCEFVTNRHAELRRTEYAAWDALCGGNSRVLLKALDHARSEWGARTEVIA